MLSDRVLVGDFLQHLGNVAHVRLHVPRYVARSDLLGAHCTSSGGLEEYPIGVQLYHHSIYHD